MQDVPLEEYEEISTRGYIATKIKYFCPGFIPKMTKNRWKGDERTEWVIRKKAD